MSEETVEESFDGEVRRKVIRKTFKIEEVGYFKDFMFFLKYYFVFWLALVQFKTEKFYLKSPL